MITGSIRQQGKNSWEIRFCCGKDPNNPKKYIRVRYTFHGTEAQAKKERDRKRYELENNIDTLSKMTVSDWIDIWLRDYVSKLRRKTRRWYEMNCRVHIVPRIGYFQLKNLTPAKLDELIGEDIQKLDSLYSVWGVYRTLRALLNKAYQKKYIKEKIMDFVEKPPSLPDKDYETLTWEEALKLLEVTKFSRRHGLYLTPLTTGMRKGEILGLKWDKVNLDKKTIRIDETLEEGGMKEIFGDPKSKTSERTILMTDELVKEFKLIQQTQELDKKKAKHLYQDYNLVFCTPIGRPYNMEGINKKLTIILKKHVLPIVRYHDLRHTAATLLYEHFGVPIDKISSMLGHSSLSFTKKTYIHDSHEIQREGVDKLNKAFKSKAK